MMHLLFIFIFLGACVVGGNWLFQHPGSIDITWLGYEITLHIVVLAFLLLLLIFVVAFFSILLWRLFTWPSRRRARVKHRTFKRGLEQLTRGVTALAMGDEDMAEEALKKALLALPNEPLPQLLNAQLLQRQGKHADAEVQFRALMNHTSTAELATRRLIEQHVARHAWADAAKLAEDARTRAPRDHWLIVTLIDLYTRAKNVAPILALTEGWQWQSPLPKEERHHFAALAYYLAAQLTDNAHKKEQSLRHAVGYAPDFLPAIIDYATLLLSESNKRSARKWLLEAWNARPVNLLIPPILASIHEDTPRAQMRLLKPFLAKELTAAHHLLIARNAMALHEYAAARTALEEALTFEESKEVATLMAEVERELRSDAAAARWLARAVDAPVGMGWVCQHCGAVHGQWHSHCTQCDHFDTLQYERPEARITSVELTNSFAP